MVGGTVQGNLSTKLRSAFSLASLHGLPVDAELRQESRVSVPWQGSLC